MADALAREYNVLPTDLLGLELSPTKKLIVNAKLLAYRNEQAKIASMAEAGGDSPSAKGVSPGDKIKAKRMRMMQERKKALLQYGVKE